MKNEAAIAAHIIRKKSGGTRIGAGRKKKYGEPTVTVSFRVPKSKVDAIKSTVKALLINP